MRSQRIILFPRRVARRCVDRFMAFTGRRFCVSPTLDLPTERHGSDYGGWEIIADSLTPDSIVYAFGVGEDITFELSLTRKYGVSIHAFDPTPRSIEWFNHESPSQLIRLHEYGLGRTTGTEIFYPPSNPNHVSLSTLNRQRQGDASVELPIKALADIYDELGHDRVDLLKMDIEGSEYSVIEDLPNQAILPDQLLVEYHHRFEDISVKKSIHAHRRLLKTGYVLYNVSDRGEEFCYVRKDWLAKNLRKLRVG